MTYADKPTVLLASEMKQNKEPVTQAVRVLRAAGVAFAGHPYDYIAGDGTSPFGTRRAMPVYCEAGIAALPRIYINGGKRGYLIALRTEDALRLLAPRLVHVAQ